MGCSRFFSLPAVGVAGLTKQKECCMKIIENIIRIAIRRRSAVRPVGRRAPARRIAMCAVCGWALGSVPALPGAADLPAAGWIERVGIMPGGVVVQAKLDTGADTSSLHASHVRWFMRDGRDWVGFDVTGDDGRTVHFEQPVLRKARVRSVAGGVQTRPVVTLGICLGETYYVTQVNLVDRSKVKEEMLIGRRFLQDRFLVDSARRHLLEPRCAEFSAS